MRNLLFLAMALTGLTSCSKDEEYENTFEVTLSFESSPEIYSVITGAPCPINGTVGVIYRSVGVNEYYAVVESSGAKRFCPVLYKDFPNIDIFRFNSDILVAVDGKKTISFYWTNKNIPEHRFMIFKTLLGL